MYLISLNKCVDGENCPELENLRRNSTPLSCEEFKEIIYLASCTCCGDLIAARFYTRLFSENGTPIRESYHRCFIISVSGLIAFFTMTG
ncbi:hypothetical protein NPIL_118801 [Nephila pilipes]|uniref:Uncharacterized protein n=1 Tax=Nephila pilipes TaxID=299642 RepID=A0A8X6Q3F3_NEPPI|nr:hypothetical protein NPIL_118801 [Nephila pilipes]